MGTEERDALLNHDVRLILEFLRFARMDGKDTPTDTQCIYLIVSYFEGYVSFDDASKMVNKYLLGLD